MNSVSQNNINTKKKFVSYSKWGYFFLIPFFLVFVIFQLIPLAQTFYYSFFTYYNDGLEVVGPIWNDFQNYKELFEPVHAGQWWSCKFISYGGNTLIIWLMGVIPQLAVALLLAVWFTNTRLKIRGQTFFKTVMYMPNLVMASAMGMLFLTLTAASGPICNLLLDLGVLQEEFHILQEVWPTRAVIAFMNWLMWYGNTALLLLSGIMGIDQSIFEAAEVDGANPFKVFFNIIMPLLKPIIIYVVITSLIGGIQLFDAAEIFTEHNGAILESSKTWMMYLSNLIGTSKNYGVAGALSVLLFIMTAGLSLVVFFINKPKTEKQIKNKMEKKNDKIIKEYEEVYGKITLDGVKHQGALSKPLGTVKE